MSEQEVCSTCQGGESQAWQCPQCARKIEEARRWIAVSERLPEGGTCLVFVSPVEHLGTRVDVAHYNPDSNGWGSYALHDWAGGNITYWMPLPSPPEGEKE